MKAVTLVALVAARWGVAGSFDRDILSYWPPGLTAGLALAGLATLALGFGLVRSRRERSGSLTPRPPAA